MKALISILAIAFLAIMITGCKKNQEGRTTSQPLVYSSLEAESTTITIGSTVKITAKATGDGLTYTWTMSGTGSFIGSGHQVIYSPCCTGKQTITCLVKDSGGNQESKSVTINVL